jgi:hypothetical protein
MAQILNEISMVGIIVDGQDGGGRTTFYPSLEELKEEEFFDYVDKDDEDEVAEAEEKFESALNGDNPYEDGEIVYNKLKVNFDDESGEITLAERVSFSWGQ